MKLQTPCYMCVRLKYGNKDDNINYYHVLKLDRTATQAEIKAAYYKLSKQYHPDRATADETMFKEVSEAYEILGNVKRRKLYDKGVLFEWERERKVEQQKETDKKYKKIFKDDIKRKQAPSETGYGGDFDFDGWVKKHYSTQRDFKQRMGNRVKIIDQQKKSNEETYQVEIMCFSLGVLGCLYYYLSHHEKEDDKPR